MTHMYDKVAELVLKHHTGEISEEEKTELNNIRQNSGLHPKMFEDLLDIHRLAAELQQMKMTAGGAVHPLTQKQKIFKYAKIAAVIIPLLLGVPQLLFQEKRTENRSHSNNNVHVFKNAEPAPATPDPFVTFKGDDLQDVLRKISQNPELEVIYTKGIKRLTFTGKIRPSTTYNKFAQDLLEVNGYRSTIKGKKIIVHS